jgi:hypothetical protein
LVPDFSVATTAVQAANGGGDTSGGASDLKHFMHKEGSGLKNFMHVDGERLKNIL